MEETQCTANSAVMGCSAYECPWKEDGADMIWVLFVVVPWLLQPAAGKMRLHFAAAGLAPD